MAPQTLTVDPPGHPTSLQSPPLHSIFPGHPQEHFIVDKTCHHCGKTRARKAGRPICRECGLCEHCGHHGSLRHRLCPVCQMRCFDQRDHRVCCQSCVKKRAKKRKIQRNTQSSKKIGQSHSIEFCITGKVGIQNILLLVIAFCTFGKNL